jgi:hypothetical protein
MMLLDHQTAAEQANLKDSGGAGSVTQARGGGSQAENKQQEADGASNAGQKTDQGMKPGDH